MYPPRVLDACAALLAATAVAIACPAVAGCNDDEARLQIRGAEVYDSKTDLTWQRCAVGQAWSEDKGCTGEARRMKFADAQALADGAWRMPTIDELLTLVPIGCRDPSINPKAFPDTPAENFWSSVFYDPMTWYVSFRSGSANPTYYSDSRYMARLVRPGR